MDMNREALTATAADLRAAAKAYYDTDVELMTDAAYDDGVEALRIAVAQNPSWATDVADLLTQVAAGQSGGGDVEHSSLMGSMDKANTLEAVTAFMAKVTGPVVVEPKMDGLAVAATYTGGKLVALTTRGDGRTGEDVTTRAARITGLPATVSRTDTFEVRGEVYMAAADFEISNTARVASGKTAFINPRNAVAGALRKATLTHEVRMSFAAYETTTGPTSHLARMRDLESDGFAVAYKLLGEDDVMAVGPDRVLRLIGEFGERRPGAGFPADGIVVKADSDTDRRALGMGSRAPRWAIAYKYDAETATTVVQGIEVSVGRTGRLSLRAKVTPVFVAGTTITYASLHNVSWLAERDIRIGDTVVIERANDVIPYISAPVLSQRPADAAAWVAPTACPQCGEPWNTATLLWRCETPECSILGRIVYAAARDCLDIEGVGVEVATALVESEKVTDIADLFTLTLDDLATLRLGDRDLGVKTAAKVLAEIVKARGAQWSRVICSTGIRMTGRTMSRRLAAQFPTMRLLRAASISSLANVEGIGQIKAECIREGLLEMAPVLNRLEAAGVNMGTEEAVTATAKPLAGQTVVVSGSVPGLSRNEVNEFVEAQGGKSSGSVSASTTMLVSEPSSSSKYVKAQALGVRIVTPAEFLVLCQG
jgi:DNA ligase (NAD+)